MMILCLPTCPLQLLVDRQLYNFYNDVFAMTLYNDTFTMTICSVAHLKTSCGRILTSLLHLDCFSYHATLLTLQNIRLCVESSINEYIIPAKSLQGNTHDMIIAKLTSSCRAYLSAKQKQKIRVQRT